MDRITTLAFTPNSLSTLNIPDTHETLLAAGGQEAELHLSLYSPPSHSLAPLVDAEGPDPLPLRGFGKQQWCSEVLLEQPASINNSVHLTSLSLSPSHESSVEPRVIISNNDKTVKFYDVAIRAHGSGLESSISPNHRMSSSARTIQRLSSIGQLKLDVPVNHCKYCVMYSKHIADFRFSINFSGWAYSPFCRRLSRNFPAPNIRWFSRHVFSDLCALALILHQYSVISLQPAYICEFGGCCLLFDSLLSQRIQVCSSITGGGRGRLGCPKHKTAESDPDGQSTTARAQWERWGEWLDCGWSLGLVEGYGQRAWVGCKEREIQSEWCREGSYGLHGGMCGALHDMTQ